MLRKSFPGPWILLCLGLVLSKPVMSQILITDRNTIKDDTSKVFLGAAAFSFDLKNRSTSRDSESIYKGINLSTDLLYLGEKHAFLMINLLDYYSVTGGKILNTGYSHIRAVLNRKDRVSPEVYVQGQYDVGRKLKQRYLAGAGARITFVHEEGMEFYMGVGLMVEHEEWKFGDYNDINNLLKNNTYIGLQSQLRDNLKFHLINYYQGGLDGTVFRQRLSGDVWVAIAMTRRLSLLARFSYQYENKPVVPINNFIYSYNNGLKISL